jgi:hypothetical protein
LRARNHGLTFPSRDTSWRTATLRRIVCLRHKPT